MAGVLFDLDQTLIDSSSAAQLRRSREWGRVYALIPKFVVYPGIVELLAMLTERNVPVGIVTSSPASYCGRVTAHHNFLITHKVCYHDTTQKKPHPEPILKGIELLGVPAGEVWAVGDDPKDIQAAQGAGAHAVAVTWGCVDSDALRAAGAELTFDTVDELHDFLESVTLTV